MLIVKTKIDVLFMEFHFNHSRFLLDSKNFTFLQVPCNVQTYNLQKTQRICEIIFSLSVLHITTATFFRWVRVILVLKISIMSRTFNKRKKKCQEPITHILMAPQYSGNLHTKLKNKVNSLRFTFACLNDKKKNMPKINPH